MATLRQLGPGGPEVFPIAFGCWRFVHTDVTAATAVLRAALDAGITLVDSADVYGGDWGGAGFGAAESLLGEVFAADPGLRRAVVLATKGGIVPGVPYDSSAAYLRSACEASLRRLGVDAVELYQVHRPDPLTPPAEVAATLAAIVQDGLAAAVGLSNHSAAQAGAVQAHLPFALASQQPELSLLCLDALHDGVLDGCAASGAAPLAWSPLAGGRLFGDACPPLLAAELDRCGEAYGAGRDVIALAWLLQLGFGVIPILGTQQPERIASQAAAADVALSREDCFALWAAARGEALP